MASDYRAIRVDNERRYGSDIARYGPMLLAGRYADRTHFIYELLQNAEDALARRPVWKGSRAMNFALSETELRISHFGKPFDDRDVVGICGIVESTKDLTAIGRFGIGFKSVYAFTDRPEVHSGNEDFAIETFVLPTPASHVKRDLDETIFVLPLRTRDTAAREEIATGLQRLGPGTLLFLRQIEEIAWSVDGGPSGLYMRSKPEVIGANARRITVIGQEEDKPEIEETWLLFSRDARTKEGAVLGQVEIAFSIVQAEHSSRWSVQPVGDSPLVAFFPTVLPTHLGFLVQGPYRTTPSRDNIPRSDPWNQYLVQETAAILVDALIWLRDHDLLDATALRCLPLDRPKFAEGNMFAPLFEVVLAALASECLLPSFGGGYIPASMGKLARSQELRELFDGGQLGSMFGSDRELAWIVGDISQDRTPELRRYLIDELHITEVTPETILLKLGKVFLEAQPDEWVLKLYEFLNGQSALRWRLKDLPLVRLENGVHVSPSSDGYLQAFLPGEIETAFPTVRRAVCATEEARKFLHSLGLTEPDPVDDVIWNVLPRYGGDEIDVDDKDYEVDIRRILGAFGTDSKAQREKLLAALRESFFIMAVDAGDGSTWVAKPGEVYLATQRLQELFEGIAGVLLVDDSYSCLRGEDVRELLEASGATRHLQPTPVEPDLTWEQRRDMRRAAGCEPSSRGETIDDWTLRGLHELLSALPRYDAATAAKRAILLWGALGDLEDRAGRRVFSGKYRWFYFNPQSYDFDAAFVQRLNDTNWVPAANGDLNRPEFVIFETLGWEPNPFLLSKIHFRPPIIEILAKEAGIEPGVLDLLKKLGLTSEIELRTRLGVVEDQTRISVGTRPEDVNDAVKKLLGHSPEPTPAVRDPASPEPTRSGVAGGGGTGGPQEGKKGRERTPDSMGGRQFVSYVGLHPDEDETDPDRLDQLARMVLEEKAIDCILAGEPKLRSTTTQNPGYDLFEAGEDGQPIRWIEVKAMTGSLHDRPVGLSRTQFESAREHRDAYWLYVVEHAAEATSTRIVRVQDPAGRARTFTFDHGWLSVAEVSDPNAPDQQE